MKLGHGGTLDPLATGVLITGVGKGTKCLQRFLECTKSYECAVLFGAATDSYDCAGKVVGRAPYQHVTKEKVEGALEKFRGKIMQRPPIFSALRVQGKRLYEYAREGKEVPVEIQERPVEVVSLELTEWLEGGAHQFHWPEEEAPTEEKAVAEKLLRIGEQAQAVDGKKGGEVQSSPDRKRKRDEEEEEEEEEMIDRLVTDASLPSKKTRATSADETAPEPLMSGALPVSDPPTDSPAAASADITKKPTPQPPTNGHSTSPTHSKGTHPLPSISADAPPCPAPAARLRMTVTSGFYVRSLCHDLGAAVGSLGLMAALVRTRQGDFELGKNVLEYADLKRGEEVWGPKVKGMLEEWNKKEESEEKNGGGEERQRSGRRRERENEGDGERRWRRNSSSVSP